MLNWSCRQLRARDGFRTRAFIPDTRKWEFATTSYSREFVYRDPLSRSLIIIERSAPERHRQFRRYASQVCFVETRKSSTKFVSQLVVLLQYLSDVRKRKICFGVK